MSSRRFPPLEEYQGECEGEWLDTYVVAQENTAYQALAEEAERAIGHDYKEWVRRECGEESNDN